MRRYVKFSTSFRVFFATLLISQVVEAQEKQPAYQPPLFRTTEEQARPALPEQLAVKLIADEDFAPYSFRSRTGSPAGISVEIAIAACEQARLACTVEARPFAEILPALERGEVDVAVTGPRLDADTLAASRMTRPYFRIMGRFAVPNTSTLDTASVSNLAGRRIGVVKDSLAATELRGIQPAARAVEFPSLAAAFAALRAGQVEGVIGDSTLLAGLAKTAGATNLVLVPEEPFEVYAVSCMLPENDSVFRNLVNLAIARRMQAYLDDDPRTVAAVHRWVGPGGIRELSPDQIRSVFEMVLSTVEKLRPLPAGPSSGAPPAGSSSP